jgi:hypothetical protein
MYIEFKRIEGGIIDIDPTKVCGVEEVEAYNTKFVHIYCMGFTFPVKGTRKEVLKKLEVNKFSMPPRKL